MGQPSLPPPAVAPPSPAQHPPPALLGGTGGCKVRCAGCTMVLNVPPGLIEFSCPYPNCLAVQMLPPELMPDNKVIGVDPTKIQLSCVKCKALLNVPHGFSRINCPQCLCTLNTDISKFGRFTSAPPPAIPSVPPPVFRSIPPPVFPSVRPPVAPSGPPSAAPAEEVNEMAKEVEQEEDEGGLAGETFTDYRPSKLSIGPPHPDPIVETSSLSAMQPPEPTYTLRIQHNLENSKALSCLQIETLVYACQRHLQHLPNSERAGFFLGDGAGVGKGRTVAGLIWENWQYGRKRALWISVGPDLLHDARRDLQDVGAGYIKVEPLNKLSYSKIDKKGGFQEGVIFLTYSSLIASSERGQSRLKQLVNWCRNFEGLIIFDECHKAKNLVPEAGSQPTKTGEAVLEIQAKLPQARVIYCSATGASEPRNMGYMVRLGLWGDGTSFLDFRDFLGAMEKGGVGALELVAMDMKARGMYVCRTLSYKGAEFEVVEVPLEANMMDMYIKAAKFWLDLRKELFLAIHNFGSSSNQLWRFYWASHQRFFRYMCMSAKVPAVVRLSKQALIDGKCVVIGLQTTGEARIEEAVTKYGLELDDFISGPRELLLKLVEDNYPLPEKPEPLHEESIIGLPRKRHRASADVSFAGRVWKVAKCDDESEDESEWQSETDTEPENESDDDDFQICNICNSEGERKKLLLCSGCTQFFHFECLVPPVEEVILKDWLCPSCKLKTEATLREKQVYYEHMLNSYEKAVARKSSIIEIIRTLDLPNNPLDDIIDQLGGPDEVAEMTGRRGMLVRVSGGKGVTYQARNTKDVTMDMVNMHEKKLFMDGEKLVAIISEAGSAGVSLQADRRALNQKRRVHLTLELPWSADRAIQQFGRTHRSNQTSAPEYRLLFTNLGGERRFASIVAKRLESLGALTQGDRRAGPSLSAYNYDSPYGKRALEHLYKGLTGLEQLLVPPLGCSAEDFIMMGNSALVSVGIIKGPDQDDGKDNRKDSRKIPGRVADSDMHDVGRFLNRLLGLAPDIQNSLFEYFVLLLDKVTGDARRDGYLDSGIVNMRANTIELQGKPKTVHVDDMSGASTMLFTFTLDRGMSWESSSTLLEEKQTDESGSSSNGFYESRREWMGKRHFILALENVASGMYKIYRPNLGESFREMSLAEVKGKYRKVSNLEKARHGWEKDFEASSNHCMHGPKCKQASLCSVGRRMQEVNVLGGLILPVWGVIAKVLAKQIPQSRKRIRVVCIETTSDSQRIVGVLIPNSAVDPVLQDLVWVQD